MSAPASVSSFSLSGSSTGNPNNSESSSKGHVASSASSAGAPGSAATYTTWQQPAQAQVRDTSHAWEAVDGSSMWIDVQEDADGNILLGGPSHVSLAAQIRQRRHRLAATDLARSSKRLVRHMLRHVFLVLDMSRWSREKDTALPPARMRMETILNLASDFVNEYYDQNPLGHLGIVLCKDGEAEMLTSLGGSPRKHKLALGAALMTEMKKGGTAAGTKGKNSAAAGGPAAIGGEFSLQNGIEVAGRSLGYAPRYGSREIVVISSALATCDPGDILAETLPRLLHAGIRVSTVALQAELHICKKLAEATGGLAGVCLDTRHLSDLIMGHAIPPPVNSTQQEDSCRQHLSSMSCEFVTMGFPSREGGDVPTLVHSIGGAGHNDKHNAERTALALNPATADDRRSNRLIVFARTGYVCPRCRSRSSDLPSDCAVCGLRLILAPHLARTFHHLFPVRPFIELGEAEVISNVDTANGEKKSTNSGDVLDSNDKKNGKRGLEALPLLASSAFTPISSISSTSVKSFVVSSCNVPELRNSRNTATKKIINIGPSIITTSSDCDRCCFGCLKVVGCQPVITSTEKGRKLKSSGSSRENGGGEGESTMRFLCPECQNIFCPDCDAYLHETLHNCPGCLCK